MTDRNVRQRILRGSTLGVGVLLSLALLLIVNYFGWKYHGRFDWTQSKIFTLSEKSQSVVAGLEIPIEIVVFLTPGGSQVYEPLQELLAQYEAASPQITVRTMDPVRNLLEAQKLAKKYELSNENAVVVASESDKRVLLEMDLAEFDYSGLQFGGAPIMSSFKGEQLITGAILELAEDRKPKLVFTTGHGERKLDDFGPQGLNGAKELLATDNVEIEEWASLGKEAVPEGTDVVVIAGPTGSFAEAELAVLDTYLAGGGRVLVLLDPVFSPTGGFLETGLEGWLRSYGVQPGQDVVLDPEANLPFFQAETLFVSNYGSHAITRSLERNELPTLVSLARSISSADGDGDLERQELLRTSASGWGERDLEESRAEQGDDDLAGPVPLGVVVEARPGALDAAAEPDGEEEGTEEGSETEAAAAAERHDGSGMRLVVYGDSDFASNRLVQANVGNQVLLFDTVNWLVEREALLGIPAKEPEKVRLSLTGEQVRWIWALVLLVLPGLSVVAGGWVYFRRRR